MLSFVFVEWWWYEKQKTIPNAMKNRFIWMLVEDIGMVEREEEEDFNLKCKSALKLKTLCFS